MEISDLSLSQMVARLMEVVGGLGLTDTTVGYYRAAFNDILSFAEASGEQGWSGDVADRYLDRLGALVASGDVTNEVGRERRRALRMLDSLAATGEADLSYSSGSPERYPVDRATGKVVDAIVEGSGASGVTAKQLRPPVRHLLWLP